MPPLFEMERDGERRTLVTQRTDPVRVRRPRGATALALTPGWLRSERMLENYGVTEASWREACARTPGSILSTVSFAL